MMDLNKFTSQLTTSTLQLFQQHRTIITTTAAVLAAGTSIKLLSRIIADYNEWYALGPNGLPLNFFGYLVQSAARPFARLDVREPAPYDQDKLSKRYGSLSLRSFLTTSLKPRKGERPEVPLYVAPQRQTTQGATPAIRDKQDAFMHALAAANPSLIQVKPSNLEGPLFNGVWLADGIPLRDEIKHMNGEFAHPHGEGSTHMVLSLVDAAAAIEKGWAERHRMSGVGPMAPWGFVLIYAPRDDEELELWKEFMVASARYVLGDETKVVKP
ncbi:hypothetical protein F5Y06DRAFT_156201 [Hypoxylon sp. FL0890]|nr:hypothetical protein F5Y06DRAFT_156201 [Hypoxylon sp. FL0890]